MKNAGKNKDKNNKKEKKMKKLLTVLSLLLIMNLCLFAGGSSESVQTEEPKVAVNPTGFPIVNEPLTLTVFGIRDANQTNWDDVYVLQKYEEISGIHMDYQEVPDQGKEENKSLLFASNDLPDVFLRPVFTQNEITRYGIESHQLMPLNDLIDEYMPNFKALMESDPAVKQAITSADGNIYALPQIDVSNTGKIDFKQWINKDWLEALDLEMPTTIDELVEVLRAFKTQDPNGNGIADEIPLGFREIGSVYQTLGSAYGLHYMFTQPVNIEDGKVHFWLKDENFKEYLMLLNQLYEEGLLWSDFYKRDLPAWRSNLSNALFGVFYMPYSDVFVNVEDQMTVLLPVKGPYDGEVFWASSKTGVETGAFAFALSSTCKNPEAACRWVDYFYSPEGSLFFRYGIEGETYYFDENGYPQMNDEIVNDERGFMTALGEICLVPGGNIPNIITSQTEGLVASNLTKEVAAAMLPYTDNALMPPSFTPEENEEVLFISQDLNNYRDQAVSRFIVGEYSFDMWDEYCETLDQIGLGRLEEIYQAAYDRSQNN